MATLKSLFPIVGSLGNLSFYTTAGSDRITVRQKGGPSKKMILTSDRFVNTRHNMSEFGGRSKGSKFILSTLRPLTIVSRDKVFNALNRPLKAIQDHDGESRKGQRHIFISRKPVLLEGFSLDRNKAFESFVSTPLAADVFPDTATAQVTIPELIPNTNLHLPDRFPFYRMMCSFAAVPDFRFTEHGYVADVLTPQQPKVVYESTSWLLAKGRFPGALLSLKLPQADSAKPFVFMLSIAIQIGMPAASGDTEPVKYQGAGKIVRVVPSGDADRG